MLYTHKLGLFGVSLVLHVPCRSASSASQPLQQTLYKIRFRKCRQVQCGNGSVSGISSKVGKHIDCLDVGLDPHCG